MPAPGPARWDALFADLEAQAEAQEQAVRDGEIAELTRAEHAGITLADRLRAAVGATVTLELLDGEQLTGELHTAATSWLLLGPGSDDARVPGARGMGRSGEHLVPVAAIGAVSGLGRLGVPASSRLDSLGIGSALRELQRDRARVVVRTVAGQVTGRLSRVGMDHLDVAETDRARTRTVPFTALTRVSRA